jgi:hypothetical protein
MDVVKGFVQNRPRTAALYASFTIGCIVVYQVLETKASGVYDYMLTLSACMQALGFAILTLDTRSAAGEGLSEKMLWAFFVAHISRISTTFWGPGYVPEDNTSEVYLYQLVELAGVALLGFKLLQLNAVRSTRNVGQGSEKWSTLGMMAAVALILAYFTKSTGHGDYFADLSWMFSVWLEAFAMFPQVLVLRSTNLVDETAMHFAFLTFASAFTFTAFWLRQAHEQYSDDVKNGVDGFWYAILSAALIRFVLCGTYFVLFTNSSREFKRSKGGGEYELVGTDEEL